MALNCDSIYFKNPTTDERVKEVQTLLKQLGYYTASIDNQYGSVSADAVKKFQTKYSLKPDGEFGPVTCKKLHEVAKTGEGTTVDLFDCPKVSLKEGASGDLVKKLQTMLQALGYYTDCKVDGSYGSETKKAVAAFQKNNGHDDDGWFGPKTCPTLNSKYAQVTGISSTVFKVTPDDTPFNLRRFTSQVILYPESVVLPEDIAEEEVSESTTNEEGETETTTTTVKPVAKASATAKLVATNFDCSKVSLKEGSKGDDVIKLQTLLKQKNYYTRQIDGDFGKYTTEAVKKLQQSQGNDPDGWFGPKTCAKLQQGQGNATNKKKMTLIPVDAPSYTADAEDLSFECTVKFPYVWETFRDINKRQKAEVIYKHGKPTLYDMNGYVSSSKIIQEDGKLFIQLTINGFSVFLEQQIEYSGTCKRSEHIQNICDMVGMKANVNMAGLKDDEFEIKEAKAEEPEADSEAVDEESEGEESE